MFDTDAESLDTTTNNQSVVQVEDSQQHQGQYAQDGGDDDEYDESEDGDDDEEDGEYAQHPSFEDLVQHYRIQDLSRARQEVFLQEVGALGNGNSYPTTTSGPPDGFPDSWAADQEPPWDGRHDERAISPSPRRPPGNGQLGRQTVQQLTQRPRSAAEAKPAMPKQSNTVKQAAGIRDQQRSNVNLPARGGAFQHNNATMPPASQPPTYSQSTRETAAPANVVSHCEPPAQADPLPHRGARPLSGPQGALTTNPTEPSAPLTRHAAARPKEEPVSHHQRVEEAPVRGPPPCPIEDYDQPTLFEMSYDQLKNEDFDTVPRGAPQPLSEDMLHKSLAERLEHVWKSLDAGDQGKFFRALPTHEWEESGDWFLGRFTDIIQRTKDARQKKRKLAKEFEDQVETRYHHVAKKQQQVQNAMGKMKTQGQGLVPRSPRASKTPRKI
ncbi:hypothetical protein BU26DRAFT_524578 [Trematosphaeria pertusa]|uniref:Extracellular mutant protein 11 C-terminal domain-containing protein n=1 Tax=Trematosphaeria pertusa TaxID=390896 RepID=A0A6A6HWR6_9PLEO|nr:uncharacterized protein BU26DRAFT_524578 [Trematosphaeria pertusa]KAF2242477.1 hypothetical protein BU26DRAFT_524578 [Trematosphaeria pertusa]